MDIYLDSLRALGIRPEDHDIRFVEDRVSHTRSLGRWLGNLARWMKITQFTYFNNVEE